MLDTKRDLIIFQKKGGGEEDHYYNFGIETLKGYRQNA
jgi:hypothetical protein